MRMGGIEGMKAKHLILLALIFLVALCGCERADLYPLCILHTNDIHGHITSERVRGWKERTGGAAVLVGCIKRIRAENQRKGIPTLVLDAGDIFMGTPEGNVSGGMAVIEIMNAAGYDALTIGNHEFDLGVNNLEKLAMSADFPFLGANVYNAATGLMPRFLKPYLLRDFGALRVGIIGVVTQETPSIVMPGGTGRIVLKGAEQTVSTCRAALAERGANFVVVVSHLGVGADEKMAREVEGVGVIIGGHSHDLLSQPVRVRQTGTLICQAESYGKYLGKLDLKVDPLQHTARKYRYEAIPLKKGQCPPDESVVPIVEKWKTRAGERFGEVVGSALTNITSRSNGESPLGDLITDSMRSVTGAEIAFHNSYGIREPLLKGTITRRDTYEVMPFDNTIYTMQLTGGQVREILEQSLSLKQGLLQVSGLKVVYDPEGPSGSRVLTVSCGGRELDNQRSYSVVTNSYLAQGGDFYSTFLEAHDVLNTGILDRDALNHYIRSHSPLSAEGFKPTRLLPYRFR
jgi:5'-nucleotidase/UDP-sugar diphosphatase